MPWGNRAHFREGVAGRLRLAVASRSTQCHIRSGLFSMRPVVPIGDQESDLGYSRCQAPAACVGYCQKILCGGPSLFELKLSVPIWCPEELRFLFPQ